MGPTTASPISARTRKFTQSLNLLAKLVLGILLISVLAETLPLRPWDPLWYLKLGQICIDYSYIFMMVVFAALMAEHLGPNDMSIARNLRVFIERLLAAGVGIYLLLIPIQILALSLHWIQSSEQVKQTERSAEKELDTIRGRINGVKNNEQLGQLFGIRIGSTSTIPANAPNFTSEKARALKSLDDQLVQVRSNLKKGRQTRLAGLFINAIKGVASSVILVFGLSKLRGLRPLP